MNGDFFEYVLCIIFDSSFLKAKFSALFLSIKESGFILDHIFCRTPVLSLGLGVDFAFAWDNNKNNKNKNNKNPRLNFLKEAVLGDKEQGLGIWDK